MGFGFTNKNSSISGETVHVNKSLRTKINIHTEKASVCNIHQFSVELNMIISSFYFLGF